MFFHYKPTASKRLRFRLVKIYNLTIFQNNIPQQSMETTVYGFDKLILTIIPAIAREIYEMIYF